MAFEDQIINFKPKPLIEDKELLEKLSAMRDAKFDKNRPKESSFSDIYSEEEISEDLDLINKYKKKWEDDSTQNEDTLYHEKIASFYEAVIAEQISSNAWFGEDCDSVPASEYDDIKNGVDIISIFNKENSRQYLGLGVDVTFSSQKNVLEDKLNSIKSKIIRTALPYVKYFEDPETGEHKKLFLPKVIVGSRLSSAENLIRLWGGKDEKKNKKLAKHPVASKLILETIAQLKYFRDFASKLSNDTKKEEDSLKYQEISSGYALIHDIFYKIYQEKKELIESQLVEVSDDIVYQTIIDYTNPKNI